MEDHVNILAQLAELKKWHEEHCAEGEASTTSLNFEEQAKLYQILGLTPSFISEIETSVSNACASPMNNESPKQQHESGAVGNARIDKMKITNDLSGTGEEIGQPERPPATMCLVKKKPFLKRGQGLTNRFKIHPDQYKLQNLPKYKFASNRPKNGKRAVVEDEPQKPPPNELESPFKYDKEKTRKSCLKPEASNGIRLEELRERMTKLCTDALQDDDSEDSAAEQAEDDEQAKRMLDFSRKSPKVTFHSEVVKIPFENYFHQEARHSESSASCEDLEGGDCEEEFTASSLHCEINAETVFKRHALSSTPVEVFKEKHADDTSTDKSPRTVLVEKGSLLREKLKELEEETRKFREQNLHIQKMKQSLELERIELHNQRQEMQRLHKEEKLKIELHFEKLKDDLKREQQKLDHQVNLPNKKFKEEVKELRDKIDELEKEIKNREMKHGASQTRLRCHIRTLEKENKENLTNIESLKKENKRLEMENARLLRQKNNKMLTEINKNIAKLAAPAEEGKEKEDPKPVNRVETKKPLPDRNNRVQTQKMKNVQSTHRTVSKTPQITLESLDKSSSESSDEGSEASGVAVEQWNKKGPSNYFPSSVNKEKMGKQVAPVEVSESEKENRLAGPLNDTVGVGPKKEVINEDGSKDVYYPNGNLKKISADGMTIKVLYFNKDIKETNVNEGTVKYYYAETRTWHTSFLDGLEILEFPSGQTEHRFKNGKIEIYFPNGLVRVTNPRDNEILEEWRYPDGTVVFETKNKEKVIKLPNGQKEIHTAEHKRREYPDGTVKLVYPDGRTETRYSNGRIRVKNKDGELLSDSQNMT